MLRLVATGQRTLDESFTSAPTTAVEQQRCSVHLDFVVEQQVPHSNCCGLPTASSSRNSSINPPRARPDGSQNVRADDVHLHFARRVAAEPGTVLNEHHLRAMPGCRNGGANARHPPAGHEQVALQIHDDHVRLGTESFGTRRERRYLVEARGDGVVWGNSRHVGTESYEVYEGTVTRGGSGE